MHCAKARLQLLFRQWTLVILVTPRLRLLDPNWCRQLEQTHVKLRNLDHAVATTLAVLGRTQPLLEKSLNYDWSQHLTQLGNEAASAAERHDSKALYGIERRLRRFKPRQLPLLLDKNGQPCRSPAQICARWQEYFAEQQLGDPASEH